MADGGQITFSTALDNEQLHKDLKRTEGEIGSLERKLDAKRSDKSFVEQQMDAAEDAVRKTKARISELKAELSGIEVPSEGAGIEAAIAKRDAIEGKLASAKSQLDSQLTDYGKLDSQWQKLDQDVGRYEHHLTGAKQRASELGEELAKSSREGSSAMAESLEGAHERFEKFSKRINTMMKKVFVFGVILAGLRAIKGFLGDTMAENAKLQSSFEGLKASLAGLAQPLLAVIIPAVTGAVNIMVAMVNTLARLIDSIFKTDLAGSIRNAKAAANAARDQAKAKKELAKQTKEATRSIMAFDEINAMSEDSSGNKSSDGDDDVNWDAFDSGKIDESLAQIMLIVGAALLAVGAILAFSGINIPLGIGLMAIGALMVYTAASENWDALPARVREAVTTALVIAGTVLLVIGIVLAFTGNIPLGIGMMVAGAALMFTAAALNWNALSKNIDTVIGVIGAVVGAAMLALGAMLALSGVNLPIGLALIAAGAVALIASVTAMWTKLPDEIRGVVDLIMAVVGVALLVLGAILAFSGVSLPVGIALLLAGAALLIAAIGLAWNALPDETRNFISMILGIVGAALLVLGIILCVTGVGLPIGIALILAGAASLVGAAAINWNFFQDKIAEVWGAITRFWDTHIAPIFTYQWWANNFKCIVNGLIYAINSGLNAFGGFINTIADGIGGILSFLGISGWSFRITMPQIPYLAQGAVIPPNKRFLAVLGDQANGTNLEAPESLIRQIVREEAGGVDLGGISAAVQQGVASALALHGGADPGDSDVTIVLQVGSEELARATNKGNRRLAQRGEIRGELAFV